MSQEAPQSTNYHHGNLKAELVKVAVNMVCEQGVDALSVRGIALAVGVSRTALYHHFKHKDELLAAVAADGFSKMYGILHDHSGHGAACKEEALQVAVKAYLRFAVTYPQQYQLMFGRYLWQEGTNSEFQRYAKDCFRAFVSLFEGLELVNPESEQGNDSALRLAQVTWSALHGMAMLANEGIFTENEDLFLLGEKFVQRFL